MLAVEVLLGQADHYIVEAVIHVHGHFRQQGFVDGQLFLWLVCCLDRFDVFGKRKKDRQQ